MKLIIFIALIAVVIVIIIVYTIYIMGYPIFEADYTIAIRPKLETFYAGMEVIQSYANMNEWNFTQQENRTLSDFVWLRIRPMLNRH